jgi:hypothetical protein
MSQSFNVRDELHRYRRATDQQEPHHDHAVDALRYAMAYWRPEKPPLRERIVMQFRRIRHWCANRVHTLAEWIGGPYW